MTQPFFSIIVPTFNRPARLLECVSSLERLHYPRDRFELIIANDGWDSPTENDLSNSAGGINFTIVSLPHRGPAAARNRAVRESIGMYLAFIDDDCTADSQWLARMETFFGAHPDALAGGKTLNSLGSNVYSEASQALIDYLYGYYDGTTAEREQFFASNNMAVSAERFKDLGGFDESYGRAAAEDRDFCERWRQ
ncbi:MAG TPA: glycosyltransferase family 2 protein, partial [Gemmatimonadaceae bacterium]|nr:glycosyltransferase family 2 protein [Gemmatimonadaceae bacterium]